MRSIINVLFLGLVMLIACNKDDNSKLPDSDGLLKQEAEYNVYKSAKLYSIGIKARSEDYSDPFEIDKVERSGDTLSILVSYKGEYASDKFDVIWDGFILESYPPQIQLIISRTASNCDNKDKAQEKLISINCKELIGDAYIPEMYFLIANGSKKPQEPNSDVTVHTVNK